jgi:serine/threonine protein kinase
MGSGQPRVFSSAFDDYSVVRLIGSGGSGRVFEAKDQSGQRVAIKVVEADSVPRIKLKRFQAEINFCLRPVSRHIVRVLDHGLSENKSPFYVMPYYSSTLREMIKAGIESERVLPLYDQILTGIEAAHLLEVCHRDIKPENILYNKETSDLVVADFGIARFKEDDLSAAIETLSNERLANFAYAAPEQRFSGKPVDHRADVYALGLLLNEMFTGQVPQGTGFLKIANVASGFSYLDELVDKMIQQQPEKRPESITKIKEELIARGHRFVELQRLNQMKSEVVPESEVSDRLISDPIRIVEVEDYDLRTGTLTLKLNQAVNDQWVSCFQYRATRFSANVSAAMVGFQRDRANVIVTEHFMQEGVRFIQEYIPMANEDYVAHVKQEHQKAIQRRRAALEGEVKSKEAKMRILGKIKL